MELMPFFRDDAPDEFLLGDGERNEFRPLGHDPGENRECQVADVHLARSKRPRDRALPFEDGRLDLDVFHEQIPADEHGAFFHVQPAG